MASEEARKAAADLTFTLYGIHNKEAIALCAQAFEAFRAQIVEHERDAIAAWLQKDAAKTRDDLSRLHAGRKLTIAQTVEWESLIALKMGIAVAIRSADHEG